MQQAAVAEIYFDESGHDGENLMAGVTPVFAHGSIHMELGEATELVAYIREKTHTQRPELKAADVTGADDSLKEELFGEDGKLVGHAQVYLVEKANFAVGKIIDLLIEEQAHERGIDLYSTGLAAEMADQLYQFGSRALTAAGWQDLVSSFTSLMRAKQRTGGVKETVDSFYEKVDNYRYKSRRENVTWILNRLWETRDHAEYFKSTLAASLTARALDPLQASLYDLARGWHATLQVPILIKHDQQTALTGPFTKTLLMVANVGSPASFDLPDVKFPLVGVHQVDSKADPRIQLADISAGYIRQIAESALSGKAEEKRLVQARQFVHHNSIWGHNDSWEQLHPS